MKKYFPIKTATACKLKWSWTTLYLYANYTASCHRTGLSKIDKNNFFNFHNTELKLKDRLTMLDGNWPEGSCSYCKDVETAGGFSDRMLHLSLPDYIPVELESDPTAINVSPKILEVYLDNTCNLGCLYCSAFLSSSIQKENENFGYFKKNNVEIKPIISDKLLNLNEEFFQWMAQNHLTLDRFLLEGGEPFLTPEFNHLLDFFEKNPSPNLELCVITNLMIKEKLLDNYITKFKKLLTSRKLKRIDLVCSIDCWGPEQEYLRYGLDLKVWKKNFEKLIKIKWLKLNINQTITPLSIKTMPELLSKLIEWKKVRPIGHFFSTVTPGPSYMMIKIFGNTEFDEDYKKILQLMPRDTDDELRSYQYMKGIIETSQSSAIDLNEISKLITFLDEKDRRRETSWRSLFPWLEKYVV